MIVMLISWIPKCLWGVVSCFGNIQILFLVFVSIGINWWPLCSEAEHENPFNLDLFLFNSNIFLESFLLKFNGKVKFKAISSYVLVYLESQGTHWYHFPWYSVLTLINWNGLIWKSDYPNPCIDYSTRNPGHI